MADAKIIFSRGSQADISNIIKVDPVDLMGKNIVFRMSDQHAFMGTICEAKISMLYVPYEESHVYDEDIAREDFNDADPDEYDGEHHFIILTLTSGRSVQIWDTGAMNTSYDPSNPEPDQNDSVSLPRWSPSR
jgi:hypothetical protein